MTPRELVIHWRQDAETLDAYAPQLASVARRHADALEAALRDDGDEMLDLDAAHRESGFSKDRLRHRLADGSLPNAGEKGAPRIRRRDLPVKRRPVRAGFDAAATARAILEDTRESA